MLCSTFASTISTRVSGSGDYKRGRKGAETYWIRFQWCGKEVRRTARTSSKMVAQQYLAQVLEEYRRLDRGGRPRCSYQEALEQFCIEVMRTLKATTQRRYGTSFRQLDPFFGRLLLDAINKARLSEFVAARRKGGATGATIRHDLATLIGVCSCAVAWDYIDANPVKAFD